MRELDRLEMTTKSVFGTSVKSERTKRLMTQESLAENAGTDRATIQRIEAGGATTLETAYNIARALSIPLDDLLPNPVNQKKSDFLWAQSRVFSGLSILSGVGIGGAKAVRMAGENSENPDIQKSMITISQLLEEGMTLYEAFSQDAIFSKPLYLGYIQIGQSTGKISEMYGKISTILEEDARWARENQAYRFQK